MALASARFAGFLSGNWVGAPVTPRMDYFASIAWSPREVYEKCADSTQDRWARARSELPGLAQPLI